MIVKWPSGDIADDTNLNPPAKVQRVGPYMLTPDPQL